VTARRRRWIGVLPIILIGLLVGGSPASGSGADFPPRYALSLAGEVMPGDIDYAVHWSLGPRIDPLRHPGHTLDEPHWHLTSGLRSRVSYVQLVARQPDGSVRDLTEVVEMQALPLEQLCTPSWAQVAEDDWDDRFLDYDDDASAADNVAALRTAVEQLAAGQRLLVRSGRWQLQKPLQLTCAGKAGAPIALVAAPEATVELRGVDSGENVVDIIGSAGARYLILRGLEISGGEHAVFFAGASDIWLDSCRITGQHGGAIRSFEGVAERLWITRNEIAQGVGEAGTLISLGAWKGDGGRVARDCAVIGNHVHHGSGKRAGGISVHQGCTGNRVIGNHIHDCQHPGILCYGSGGGDRNLIAGNICHDIFDVSIQVQGGAVVRNNLTFGGVLSFLSKDHLAGNESLEVVHNTFINAGSCVRLANWRVEDDEVFANNICYSSQGLALVVDGEHEAVLGNVLFGSADQQLLERSRQGRGLQDFVDLSWDGERRDARPALGSPLLNSGLPRYLHPWDRSGELRIDCVAGCEAAVGGGLL